MSAAALEPLPVLEVIAVVPIVVIHAELRPVASPTPVCVMMSTGVHSPLLSPLSWSSLTSFSCKSSSLSTLRVVCLPRCYFD